MLNKRKRSALDRASTDPYTLGYKAGLTGQSYDINPYTKDIPNNKLLHPSLESNYGCEF